jgi:MoxR-like ATPase
MSDPIMQPDELRPHTERARAIVAELDRILLGRNELHRFVVNGILSRGHVLLEGVPGVGKTALAKGLGEILGLELRRVQFTPDLMPSDILGANILQESGKGREMVFRPGPIFANILLADEINRASPKTQSALLEAMQERAVTLLGTTRPLPAPFFVIASQNPIEFEGTYPLPEAQIDRFLFRLNVGNIDASVLEEIISTRRRGEPPAPQRRLSAGELDGLFAAVDKIFLPRPVARYIARLVAATHPNGAPASAGGSTAETVASPAKAGAPLLVEKYVTLGASPRAAISIAEAARAEALLEGRPTAGFDDVRRVAAPVLNHRLILNYRARVDAVTTGAVINDLLATISETGIRLPEDVAVGRA